MSKSVKRVLSVAAVIAIPFVAPMVAASAFMAPLAGAIGTTATSALSGAALGAAKGAVFGEDIGKQALFGALGGGLRQMGLNAQAAEAAAAAPSGPMTAASGASAPTTLSTSMQQAVNPQSGLTAGTASTGLSTTAPGGLAAGMQQAYAAQQGPSFMEALKSVPAEIAAKYRDPKALADLTLRAAGQMAGSLAAGSGLTDQEQALVDAQRADLEEARRQNAAIFQLRLAEAQKLIGESAYFDPEYFGLDRARDAQRAGAYAKRAGLRGMTDERRSVAERQYDLGIARNVGTAYDSGYQTGVQGRLSTRAAGLAALPGGYPTMDSSYQSLMAAYGNASERRRQTQQDIGDFLDPYLDPNRERETDDDQPPRGG